jgi:hypothetical protein
VPAPHGQALAHTLLEVAATHDRAAGVAGEYPPARLHLVVDVEEAGETAGDVDEELEPPRIDILAVEGDVPPARER